MLKKIPQLEKIIFFYQITGKNKPMKPIKIPFSSKSHNPTSLYRLNYKG